MNSKYFWINQGRIQDFYLEGAQKIVCMHAPHEREAPSPLRPGALEALGGGGGGGGVWCSLMLF